MDGNRRWAKSHNLNLSKGHDSGLKKMMEIIEYCTSLDIKYLSFYSFSSENWFRSIKEIYGIFNLINIYGEEMIQKWKSMNIKVKIIGDKKNLPHKIKTWITKVEEKTCNGSRSTICLVANYSGRQDIINAANMILNKFNQREIKNINENEFSKYLYTKDIPDPDLCIRTGYESRLSNFFLWQMAYTELEFLDVFWPNFSIQMLQNSLNKYKNKDRRLGI